MHCYCGCTDMCVAIYLICLQKKVEETLKSAAMKADVMIQRQEDLFSVLHTLDEGIKYGNENDAHLTVEARKYKAQLHVFRSMCVYDLVGFLSAISIVLT